MSPRTVYRYVSHTVRQVPESGVIYEAFCSAPDCNAASGPQDVQEAAQDWALAHAGRTDHCRFRRVVTDHARVTRDE